MFRTVRTTSVIFVSLFLLVLHIALLMVTFYAKLFTHIKSCGHSTLDILVLKDSCGLEPVNFSGVQGRPRLLMAVISELLVYRDCC